MTGQLQWAALEGHLEATVGPKEAARAVMGTPQYTHGPLLLCKFTGCQLASGSTLVSYKILHGISPGYLSPMVFTQSVKLGKVRVLWVPTIKQCHLVASWKLTLRNNSPPESHMAPLCKGSAIFLNFLSGLELGCLWVLVGFMQYFRFRVIFIWVCFLISLFKVFFSSLLIM